MPQVMYTPYPDINELLDRVHARMKLTLGDKFVGLYLFGSLVMGDFAHDASDIDLVAATSDKLDEEELDLLEAMHRDIAHEEIAWEGRIEVHYISVAALRSYDPHYRQAHICPGEPFNVKAADDPSWIINRWVLREKGVTLDGPGIERLIDPISKEEVIQASREATLKWHHYMQDIRDKPFQGYAVLTMCRALYTLRHGEIVSKKHAAEWAGKQFPGWYPLIQAALMWRIVALHDELVDHESTLPETLRFVRFALSLRAMRIIAK